MSSLPAKTTMQRLLPEVSPKEAQKPIQPAAEKRLRFSRSSSLQKIKDLNVFICSSYHFFMLPVSSSLKSSHGAFALVVEKYVVFLKVLIAGILAHQHFAEQFKTYGDALNSTTEKMGHIVRNSGAMPAIAVLMFVSHSSLSYLLSRAQKTLFNLSVYLTFCLIFLQLAGCVFVMSQVIMSTGLMFLLGCILLIFHVYVKITFHDMYHGERRHTSSCNGRSVQK